MSDKTKNVCPRCGKEMEEFAVAWGWDWCHKCSMDKVLEGIEKERKQMAVKHRYG